MRSNLQRTIALTCIVSLVIASIAIAENDNDYRRGQRGGQGRYRQGGGGYGDRRGSSRGEYGGGEMGQGMGSRGMGGRGMGGRGMGGRGMGPEQRGGLIPEMIRQKLNLTDEQAKAIDEIEQVQMKERKIISEKDESLRDKLEAAVDKGDKEAIVNIAGQMGKTIGDTAILRVSSKDSLKKILNEKQLDRFEKFEQQMKDRREKMKKKMGGRMGGLNNREGMQPPMGKRMRESGGGRGRQKRPLNEGQRQRGGRQRRSEHSY